MFGISFSFVHVSFVFCLFFFFFFFQDVLKPLDTATIFPSSGIGDSKTLMDNLKGSAFPLTNSGPTNPIQRNFSAGMNHVRRGINMLTRSKAELWFDFTYTRPDLDHSYHDGKLADQLIHMALSNTVKRLYQARTTDRMQQYSSTTLSTTIGGSYSGASATAGMSNASYSTSIQESEKNLYVMEEVTTLLHLSLDFAVVSKTIRSNLKDLIVEQGEQFFFSIFFSYLTHSCS